MSQYHIEGVEGVQEAKTGTMGTRKRGDVRQTDGEITCKPLGACE